MTLLRRRGWLRRFPVEALFWAAALAALAAADPRGEGLVSLCVLKAVGWPFCPGCGLGHSVAYLFRGEPGLALAAHPLGPFAVVVLAGRVVTLAREAWRQKVRTYERMDV